MNAICTRCHQLYEALELAVLEPSHLCPRCGADEELLDASEALHMIVGSIAGHPLGILGKATTRVARAIERARAAR